jgi:serine/threonine-protein kinase
MHPLIAAPRLSPGEIVAGKYRVVGALGSGGFGQVFAAENLNLGSRVAIKVQTRADSVASAWREARAAARLRSPHTVRIFDVDRLPDGSPYIVMEFLEGVSLRQYLLDHGRVPCERALRWALELCVALEEAHAARLIHRDIKPSNIFLVGDGEESRSVKLLDFGLAKALDGSSDESRTESGVFAGSPAYMSPERVRGMPATTASDIWSLGVVLHEMLCGRRPFTGDGAPALFAAIVADQPTPLREVAPDIPEPVEALVARCLRKAPRDRATSIEALGRELSGLVNGIDPAGSAADDTKSGLTSLSLPGDRTRRSRLAVVGLAVAALLVSLSAVLVARLSQSSGEERQSASTAALSNERARPNDSGSRDEGHVPIAESMLERGAQPATSTRPKAASHKPAKAPSSGLAPRAAGSSPPENPALSPPQEGDSLNFFDEPDF